jgi:hypothetical protein
VKEHALCNTCRFLYELSDSGLRRKTKQFILFINLKIQQNGKEKNDFRHQGYPEQGPNETS